MKQKQTFAILLLHLVARSSSAFVMPTFSKPGPGLHVSVSTLSRPVVLFYPPAFVSRSLRTTPLSLSGGDNLVGDKKTNDEEQQLISFSKLPVGQYDALVEYVRQWAKLLEGSKGLTTPVKVVTTDDGAKILFQPKQTTYKSKSEERASEQEGSSTGAGDSTNKKKAPMQEGGVEIWVDKRNDEVVVQAKRCDMDEDTMIREMSEETIVDGLKKAMSVWKKDHANK